MGKLPPNDEDALVAQLTALWQVRQPSIHTGPGDDCALLMPVPKNCLRVFKIDCVVENTHFLPADPPRKIGHKALARVMSDFAAMGATPEAALVAVGIPRRLPLERLRHCYRGMHALAKRWGIGLAGGELTRSSEFWLAIALTGRVRTAAAVHRTGARAGDLICVTGILGGALPRRHLAFEPRLAEGQWLAQNKFAAAMMDISDGLGKDLPRMARASGLSFEIYPDAIPKRKGISLDRAIDEGEDYELLFSVSPERIARLQKTWPFSPAVSIVGRMLDRSRPANTAGLNFRGFDHLSKKQDA